MAERKVPPAANGSSRDESNSSPEPSLRKQLGKVIPAVATALYIAAAVYVPASPFARTRSGKVWLTLGLCAAGLLIIAGVLWLYKLARKYRSRQIRTSAGAIVAAVVVILAIGVSATYLIWRGRVSTTVPPAGSHSVSGTISWPADGTSNVCQNKTLNASGTAENVQKGHHLWLFLYVASANNGTGLYYPGDREPLFRTNGQWSGGAVFIGGTGQPGQRLTLWLVDLGPGGYQKIGVNVPGSSPGFAVLRFAPDVAPLKSVTFTTADCTTTSGTPAKTTAPVTRPPPVVFRDDFCTTAGGWTLGSTQTGGHYSRCALRIYANGNDVESSEPMNAGTLPRDITIDVRARRILGSATGDEFGIACRSGSEGYTFIVQANSVSIYRYSSTTGIKGRQPLAQAATRIDMNMSSRLRASCATVNGAAHLTFWVNGTKLAEATDASNPLTSGTVALFAATTPGTSTPTEAEFTNFMVTRLR